MTRDEAWTLFCEWTESESLRRHVLAVEACMRAYARKFGEDEERWGMVGMLHDLDYERYPDLHTGHLRYALAELERLDFPEDIDPRGRLARGLPRGLARHADGEDALRRRRAVGLRHGLRLRAPGRASTG